MLTRTQLRTWRRGILSLLVVLALVATGCSGDGATGTSPTDTDGGTPNGQETPDDQGGTADDGEDRSEWPDPVVYGLLPTGDVERLQQNYAPFQEFLSECLDHPVELFTGTNYVGMIEAMRTDNLHVSKFGPFSYILAHDRADAEAFVTGVDDPDAGTYESVFVSLEKHGLESAVDLEGQSFGFVDPASTSGHIFPRAYLIETFGVSNDEVEDVLGEVVFTGGHDATVTSVLNEEIVAGSVSSNLTDDIEEDDRFIDHPNFDQLELIDRTDPIPRALEAYAGDLPESLKQRLSECFQDVIDQPELESFLEEAGYLAGFVPTEDSNYDVIREAASALGMSPEELLEE